MRASVRNVFNEKKRTSGVNQSDIWLLFAITCDNVARNNGIAGKVLGLPHKSPVVHDFSSENIRNQEFFLKYRLKIMHKLSFVRKMMVFSENVINSIYGGDTFSILRCGVARSPILILQP